MFRVQPKASAKKKSAKSTALPRSQGDRKTGEKTPGKIIHAPQSAAVGKILEGVPRVIRSVRVLVMGASQRGKTTWAQTLCAALGDRDSHLLVFDQKWPDHAQYAGMQVHTLGELRRAILAHTDRVICRAPLGADEVASAARDLAECGERVTLLADEITPELRVNPSTGEPVERVWAGPALTWLCLQGGGLGASFVQLCQLPRMVPGSLIDQATAYVVFGIGGRSLSYAVDDLRVVPREAKDIVSSLAVGEFCVFFPDQNWDWTIYGPT